METVKRKDGTRYRESYYFGNKKINSPYFTRKTDAKTWKSRVETEKLSKLALGEHYHKIIKANFKEYAERWIHSHVEVNCTHKTLLSYDSILRTHLYPKFEKLNLDEITEDMAMNLMNNLKRTHKSSVIKNIWIVLRSIINRALKEKILIVNPIENIKKPKPELKKDNFWIISENNQFLLANRKDPLYLFFFVALYTGLRPGELCGLKWDRIDFQSNHIFVTRTRDKYGLKENTKTSLPRHVPMTSEVRLLLLSHFKTQREHNYVFIEQDGSEVKCSHIYRRLQNAQKRAGVKKITVHDLRHTFASNFMMNGGNIFDLQKILGHADIKMTMRYAHFTPGHLQGSLKFMNMSNELESTIPVLDPRESKREENLLMLGS